MRMWLIRALIRSFKHAPPMIYSEDASDYQAWLIPRVPGRDYGKGA